jgi:ADP-ribose pyrophosphatase YjhB (NUDIX family)
LEFLSKAEIAPKDVVPSGENDSISKISESNLQKRNKIMENFEVCIRAIIQNKGKILVCFNKEKGYYFFPGGHLNFGEEIGKALSREIKEELGMKIKKFSFIGLVDNVYKEDGKRHHEINLVFNVIPKKNNF